MHLLGRKSLICGGLIQRLDQEAEGKYAPSSAFFVRWLTDVGGRPGFGIMHTYGELPEVVVDFKNKRIHKD